MSRTPGIRQWLMTSSTGQIPTGLDHDWDGFCTAQPSPTVTAAWAGSPS
ncbi:hypothetical protein [Ornithinimicrobium panacihumi]